MLQCSEIVNVLMIFTEELSRAKSLKKLTFLWIVFYKFMAYYMLVTQFGITSKVN